MARTHVDLDPEQAEALKRLATERGVSVAEVVRQGIDALIRSPEAAAPSHGQTAATAERSEAAKRAKQAVRDAILEETDTHVVFDPQALDRAYELLLDAEPERRRRSMCGKVSVGFPVRGEDYEDAPNDD